MISGTVLLLAFLLHPLHETIAEVEWNAKTGRLEVALRLSVLDEQWIRRQSEDDPEGSAWATRYLKTRFQLDPKVAEAKQKSAARYFWVGREERGSHVWWYFEIEPTGKTRPRVISQRMLFDLDEAYLNRVVVLGQKTRRAVTLSASKPTAKLPFADAK